MERQKGVTHKYFDKKQYGFLLYTVNGREAEMFFKRKDLACDWKGSRAHLFVPGVPVTFTIVREASKRDPLALCAKDIQPEPAFVEEPGNLETYWEIGQLITNFGERRFAFARRPDEDDIYVRLASIRPEFEDRISEICVGDFVAYQIEKKDDGFWRAISTELFSREENERLRAGLSLEEPAGQSVALTPENRIKTLAEIIAEGKEKSRGNSR